MIPSIYWQKESREGKQRIFKIANTNTRGEFETYSPKVLKTSKFVLNEEIMLE